MKYRNPPSIVGGRRGLAVFTLTLTLGLVALVTGAAAPAVPSAPVDESSVPHYFGPYPNWANSPFALPDAQVIINGRFTTQATAEATVGANGGITGITVTDGGSGYTQASVVIAGSGTGATAKANIVKKGAIVDITVTNGGTGYTAPTVSISGGGSGAGAAATAYGKVEQVTVTNGGSGYTFPTVDFDLPDGPNGVQAKGHADLDANGTITAVVIDDPGSGYSFAPGVAIRNGTVFDPIPLNPGGSPATATATLVVDSITIGAPGANYTQTPTVMISDPTGSGAAATATLDNGVIASIDVTKAGSGYIAPGGIRKFVDTLPGLGPAAANNLGQYIPVAKADTTTFPGADYYEIALVEYQEQMHTDLPATKQRGYVQLETSVVTGVGYPLPGGKTGVDEPHFLGPTIVAQKDRPVRIKFVNLLPTDSAGDLFLPTDSTIPGSGFGPGQGAEAVDEGTVVDEARNPACSEHPKPDACFSDNRATLHLHGGNTPWISDGTTHQWITPAGETTAWPEGVSVRNVPDMPEPEDGSQTFYYTNQQSARLMFYHDHSFGITRLNVYAGEAAGYVLRDAVEQKLIANGTIPGNGAEIPLVIQDRTFVPQDEQLAWQDPTWDKDKWGGYGSLWYHHVYMPAQNPGDPSGMSGFGRWMYGPWFWPPAGDAKHGPIANPYYNKDPEGPDGVRGTSDDWTTEQVCNLDDPATWQYDTEPFCEPPQIPGTPNISVGMEQFNDTPIVNGTAYPTVTLDPKSYRLRILNAANDRFWNLQWYVADSTGTEVALKADEVAAAQLDPVVFPTPDTTKSPVGPSWIQIGTEGGFLPAPAVVPNQPITWIKDPTRFDVGNVDQHSLLLAPAERADAVVDFSKYAGKTLILYNDAPAAFPARIPSYDYYTGAPDLRPVGAPTVLPGYGPNTRTIMQVKIRSGSSKAFNLNALRTAFSHKADGSGVFEAGQHPIIVGQAAYNSAYGTSFVNGSWCNAPGSTSTRCDGFARISEQGGDTFKFNTLRTGTTSTIGVKIEPKAIHDEMNSSNFDEFGRMQAVLGVEAVPATPGLQNVVLHPFVYPGTEVIDASGLPSADVKVSPIASGDDGTQIWKVTHNGVDTHPIHFHAYDVQVLNRVAWDNNIMPPDANELGWKDTVRISPLQDTIIALRPVIPKVPFDIPNSVRLLNPTLPDGAWIANTTADEAAGLPIKAFAPNGDPIDVVNHYVNFGAEYTYHCHILSHEEMDMMRPVSIALPPVKPGGLAFDPLTGVLTWTDNSVSETAFTVQKLIGGTWTTVDTVERPLLDPNTTGDQLTYADPTFVTGDQYRVVAQNAVGDTWDYSDPNLNEIVPGTYAFPVVTTQSISEVVTVP